MGCGANAFFFFFFQIGTVIEGVFTCHKGIDNPRELDCEIQYSVNGSPDLLVQSFHLQ